MLMCRCVKWREKKMTVLITATGSYVFSCIRACPLTVVGTKIVLVVMWYKGISVYLVGIPLVLVFV